MTWRYGMAVWCVSVNPDRVLLPGVSALFRRFHSRKQPAPRSGFRGEEDTPGKGTQAGRPYLFQGLESGSAEQGFSL